MTSTTRVYIDGCVDDSGLAFDGNRLAIGSRVVGGGGGLKLDDIVEDG